MSLLVAAQENHKQFEKNVFYTQFAEKLINDIRLILEKKGAEETEEELKKFIGFKYLWRELHDIDSHVLKYPGMKYEVFLSYFGFYLGFLRNEVGLKTKG